MPAMYPDRVITIKGTIDNMSAAEASISQKLRECIEKEMQVRIGYNLVDLYMIFFNPSFMTMGVMSRT